MRKYLKNSLFITLSLISILLIFSILISEIINEKKNIRYERIYI